MTTYSKTVTAESLTRSWLDIDPKVRNAAIVALAADLAALGAWLQGTIGLHALFAGIAFTALPVLAGYVTTSKHRAILEDIVDEADEVAHDVAPIIEEAAPEAAPAVAVAVDGIDALHAAFQAPVSPVSVPATAAVSLTVPVAAPAVEQSTTSLLATLPAVNSATGGGQ